MIYIMDSGLRLSNHDMENLLWLATKTILSKLVLFCLGVTSVDSRREMVVY